MEHLLSFLDLVSVQIVSWAVTRTKQSRKAFLVRLAHLQAFQIRQAPRFAFTVMSLQTQRVKDRLQF
jgi:hypothetical protein